MLDRFLREMVIVVVGKQAELVADVLNSKKHVNEFIIAKKLNITINQTRNVLYKLADYGLVSSIRKKDKKKGWYTYFWKIEVLKSLEFLKDLLNKRKEQILFQIKSRESKEFYVCERCNIEFSEESALLHDFTCGECGGIFSRKDSTKLIKELKKQVEKIDSELSFVEEEIRKEQEKIGKGREKEAKKEAKVKMKEREVRKRAKAKERDKERKGKGVKKKAPKKKIAKKKIIKKKVAKRKKPNKKSKKKSTKKLKPKKKVNKKKNRKVRR